MGKRIFVIFAAMALLLTSCASASEGAVAPLMGIEWFTDYDAVKDSMADYVLLAERRSTEQRVPQKMQDYADVQCFGIECDLTLCFTESGLIGFNYHDVKKNQNYRQWYETLETNYGVPTEESSGMASWYENPAGRNTAVYLFNLEEGVQVSLYATADSPDKSYDRREALPVPAPEIRTPIVPAEMTAGTELMAGTELTTETAVHSEEYTTETTATAAGVRLDHPDILGTDTGGQMVYVVTDVVGNTVTDRAGQTVTTVVPRQTTGSGTAASGRSTTHTAAAPEKTTETVPDRRQAFLQNGLTFYGSPDSERRKMNRYKQLYEYRTGELGQPWELIMEYENVPYERKNCEAVLCFTSLGLVGVNYFDSDASDYRYWVQTLTEIYGQPDEAQDDYTVWSSAPVGDGTMIYVFALEDGVQISFFADDAGSELIG